MFMKTEFLKGFGLSDEDIQKILAENGRDVEREKAKTDAALEEAESLRKEKQDLTDKVTELSDNATSAEEYKKQLESLRADIKEKEEKERLEAEDRELTTAIMDAIGNKQFSSDYAKEGVIRDMKSLIAQKENKGKSYAELFEAITKDKEGIFANPNPPAPMTGMGKVDTGNGDIDKMRAAMGLDPIKE